jgi:phosphopantothenoylcysteine synthetase/decarboxylase
MDAYPRATGRVVYLVVCAGRPARQISELVERIQRLGWIVCVVATPSVTGWLDLDRLAEQTGYPVRSTYKLPDEPDLLPRPDAVIAVPATFNTINKWAAGINDTLALGLLNEALGMDLAVFAVPFTSPPLAAHPAYRRSLAFLRDQGVTMIDLGSAIRWSAVTDELTRICG